MNNESNIDVFTETFNDLPIGIGIFNVENLEDLKSIRYVFMNKVILHEMRKKPEEVLGKRIIEIAPEAFEHEAGLQVIETYRNIAKNGGSINLGLVEYSNHMVAGTYECSVHHIQDNFVYVMLRNVTDLELAKNELANKNKELSEFAYMVSHDLKEPLRTISSFTGLLTKKYRNQFDEKGEKILNFIKEASTRMNNLINSLLEYSSLQEEEFNDVDCNMLIKIIKQDLHTQIQEKKAIIFTENLPIIKGHKTQLRLLFQNLISNAIKFSKKDMKPQIKICFLKDTNSTFVIEDNGIGIPIEQQNKIFNVFQRLHTDKEYKGTGIGLAHCKKIVDLHKGKIWVDSEPNVGSKFYFTIPQFK